MADQATFTIEIKDSTAAAPAAGGAGSGGPPKPPGESPSPFPDPPDDRPDGSSRSLARRSDGGGPFGRGALVGRGGGGGNDDVEDAEWEYRPPQGRPMLAAPAPTFHSWLNPPNPNGIIGGLNASAGDPNHPLDKSMFSLQGLGIAAGVAATALRTFSSVMSTVTEYLDNMLRADILRLQGETSLSRAQETRAKSRAAGNATGIASWLIGGAMAAAGVATANPALIAGGAAVAGVGSLGAGAIQSTGEESARRIERDIEYIKAAEARIAKVGMYNPVTAMASAQRRALGIGLDAREAMALGPEYAAMTAAQARLEAAERVVKVVEDQKRLREQEIATNQRTREMMQELNKAMQGADRNTKRMVEIMLGNSNPLAKFFQKLDLPEWGDMREGMDDLGKLRDEQMARPVYEGL